MTHQQNNDFELIYNRFVMQFGGRQIISLPEAAEVLNYSKSSASSMLCRGAFPIKTVVIGSKNAVRVIDLARYVSSLAPHITPPPAPTPTRPRGRPAGTSIAAQYAKINAAADAIVGGGVQ